MILQTTLQLQYMATTLPSLHFPPLTCTITPKYNYLEKFSNENGFTKVTLSKRKEKHFGAFENNFLYTKPSTYVIEEGLKPKTRQNVVVLDWGSR